MGLTQPELAEKAGIGLRFLRELESGRKTNFNTDTLIKLLQFLGRVKLKLESSNNFLVCSIARGS